MSSAAVASSHSHRPTTKISHKPFKSRKATKGQLRDQSKGRIESSEKGQRKTPHQQVMSKFDRRNQAKQRQLAKHKEHVSQTSIFTGRDAAPRIVAVLPLCPDGDSRRVIRAVNESVDIEAELEGECIRVPVDRFKQKLQYLPAERDLNSCLDAARIADFVIVILSATEEVDSLGELILRSVESQGLSTVYTVVQSLDKIEPAKQKTSVLASLRSFITHFHPDQEKLFSIDNRQECSNLMRALCNTTPKGVHWRDERSWMLVEDVKLPTSPDEPTVFTGVVRGRGLKADRLIQVGDMGTFKIDKITAAPLEKRSKKGGESMAVDAVDGEEKVLDTPTEDQDDLVELAPEEIDMGDDDAAADIPTNKKGVLLDDHHYFSDEEAEAEKLRKKRVPKGTSTYQSAWYLDDDNGSDSDSDMEDLEMNDDNKSVHAEPQDGVEGLEPADMMDTVSEYPQSEMVVEPTVDEDAAQLAAYRAQRNEAEDDKEFPDEIELHPNVLARERLARFRGLKSLRSSPWQESEDKPHEPEDWSRLLQVSDYSASRSRATREALVGGVDPGTRVNVYISGLPADFQASALSQPMTLISLLRHEHKKTVVNYLISLSSDSTTSIKSKEELIIQCGPRRFVANPLFSQPGTTPNNVHKYCRFIHPGQTAVASFIGPVTWGAVPTLFFKRTVAGTLNEDGKPDVGLTLVGAGTALPPSKARVVVKRVVLTGHPFHIHKKVVTIRYMFFNRDDVEWFKALPLWTKRGRSGYIKESVGTHGYFKATFDAKINPQDSVGVSLYKRVFPRSSTPLKGALLDVSAAAVTTAVAATAAAESKASDNDEDMAIS